LTLELNVSVADNDVLSFEFSNRGLHLPGGDALARSHTPEKHLSESAGGIVAEQPE
jgi:hypothetical protein